MLPKYPIVLLGLFFCVFLHADEYEDWKENIETEYQNYLTAEQQEFEQGLKSDWENVRALSGARRDTVPKLDKLPKADPAKSLLPSITVVVPEPDKKPQRPPVPASEDKRVVDFIGVVFALPALQNWDNPIGAPDNRAIASAWAGLVPQLGGLTQALRGYIAERQLSDWAVVSLVRKYADLESDSENNAVFLTWSILLELGYDTRLAYDSQYLYLLARSQQPVFVRQSIRHDGTPYYFLFRQPASSVFTYKHAMANKKAFDFSFGKSFIPGDNVRAEKHVLSAKAANIQLEYLIYPELAEYYRQHPQLDFDWYFKAKTLRKNYESLIVQLRQALKGKPEAEQVQILLNIVQFGFQYQLDQDQWGEEYYAVPEHTLMLSAADCEDRSFLFALLVEEVVGIETIGLHYPGHVSVAVALKGDMQGARYYEANNRRYYVADPTYIGARIGEEIPKYAGSRPRLIY